MNLKEKSREALFNNFGAGKEKYSVDLKDLEGRVISFVEGLEVESEMVIIKVEGYAFVFYHDQCCCESVYLADYELGGNLEGSMILKVEEVSHDQELRCCDSQTWTFYKIHTTHGSLWMRWMGESNGNYSEKVYLGKLAVKGELK